MTDENVVLPKAKGINIQTSPNGKVTAVFLMFD